MQSTRYLSFSMTLAALSIGIGSGWAESGHEEFRPAFHFSPQKNWTNDPNGLVYFGGLYHLFFQYNPLGDLWGHMSWGHAVSKDLLHWDEWPVALKEENGIMIYSGSAVDDARNSSGFGRNGQGPLVAVYTGDRPHNESQNLAYSNDGGKVFQKYGANPVIDIKYADFRDPMVFWHEPSHKWIMVVSLAKEFRVRFYASQDLKQWTRLSEFGPAGVKGIPNWECPNFFELPVEGSNGKRKWVLIIGVADGGPGGGSATQYFIGDFDGTTFVNSNPPDEIRWVDYGADFYAAQTWSNVPASDGRRILLAWMSNWKYAAKLPTSPWRGQMSLPRTLKLVPDGDGMHLVQQPVSELKSLRGQHIHIDARSVEEANAKLKGQQFDQTAEITARIERGQASEVEVQVRKGGEQYTALGYAAGQGVLYIDRKHSGRTDFAPTFAARHEGPVPKNKGEIELQAVLDRCSVELFGDGGRTALTDLIFPDASSKGVQISAQGGPIGKISMDVWSLTPNPAGR